MREIRCTKVRAQKMKKKKKKKKKKIRALLAAAPRRHSQRARGGRGERASFWHIHIVYSFSRPSCYIFFFCVRLSILASLSAMSAKGAAAKGEAKTAAEQAAAKALAAKTPTAPVKIAREHVAFEGELKKRSHINDGVRALPAHRLGCLRALPAGFLPLARLSLLALLGREAAG